MAGLPWWVRLAVFVVPICLVAACEQPKVGELEKEVQGLKTEIAVLKEKLAQTDAAQQKLQAEIKELARLREAPSPLAPPVMIQPAPGLPPGAPPAALSVEQILKDKDRYLGTRVVVRGQPGPVLMHKKILYLQSPEGLLEVNFSLLQDKKQLDRLTSQTIETPVTVTGTLGQAAGVGKGPARLQITAESVEF